MELNINSPVYYTNVFGVDDEIYKMCRELYVFFKDKAYSEVIKTIGIAPIVAPNDLLEKGKYKEVKYCSTAYEFASVSLQIDYGKYTEAGMDEKKSLIVKNVVDSVKAIKSRGKVDFCLFQKDMMRFCEENGIRYISE